MNTEAPVSTTTALARRMDRRQVLKSGAAAGLGLILLGCGTKTTSSSKSRPDLTIILGDDIDTLDPYKTTSAAGIALAKNIVDNLLRIDKSNYPQVGPRIATSWQNLEPTRWRLKLRQGVKFTNGDPLDAEAAKWAVDNAIKNDLNAVIYKAVVGAEVVDAHTIDLRTSAPTGLLPLQLCAGPELLSKRFVTGPDYNPGKQLGSGPAKFVEWVRGDHLTMHPNDDFYGGRQSWGSVRYRPVSQAATRANAAISGEADIVVNILPQDLKRLKAARGVRAVTKDSTRCAHIRIQDDVKPFDNKLVRQALNYAVDVPGIVRDVLLGLGTPMQGQMQAKFAANWQADVRGYPHDPDKARSLLAQAGYPRGFHTTLGTSRGHDQNDYEFSQAIAGQLQKVGIDVELVTHEAGEYIAMYSGQKPADPLFYWSSGNIIPAAENVFRDLMLIKGASFNIHTPELMTLYNTLRQTVDAKERERLSRQGIDFVRDYCPAIFGYQIRAIFAVADRVDWTPRPFTDWIYLDEIKVRS
jgi:peptide/nickel transport system substrate-binding protein